ncbi:glycosyltransferase, partial [Bosea eneae]
DTEIKLAAREAELSTVQLKLARSVEHAETEVEARRDVEARLAAREAELSTLQSELERLLKQSTAEVAQMVNTVDSLANRLRMIETSTTWRVAARLMPILIRARPVLRPIVGATRRLAAAGRGEDAQPGGASADVTKLALDLTLQTSLVPEWHETESRYRLRVDEEILQKRRKGPTEMAGLIAPYVVVPLQPIPPGIRRSKILHVIPNVFVGGSTQLIIDILQHLSHLYEQEVLTSARWRGGDHVGMTVHCVSDANSNSIREIYHSYAPDIIHIHYWGLTDDPWYKAAFDALDAAPGAQVVENVNTPIAPMIVPRVNHYVFVSEYVRTEFGSAVADPDASSVIYPGIDLSRFSKSYDGHDAKNAIGMVYRLENDKLREDAIDLFIEVVKRRPRTRAVIVGGGSFLEGYINRTIAADVRENFHFTGYVPYEDLPDLYDTFSIFVAPVWKESFGQVSPFAMAKGLAVAGYAVGALPEIVGRTETFATDLHETSNIIVNLLNAPQHLQEVGDRNRARATTMFAVETMVERYNDLYSKLLQERTSRLMGS